MVTGLPTSICGRAGQDALLSSETINQNQITEIIKIFVLSNHENIQPASHFILIYVTKEY